ncbi:MAG TPA: hypothetical protein VJ981_01185, partial [Gammaproteobacteria bacterium]|nr:hypothetical protein [Gammaproteobacteria bacterium]
IIFPHQLNINNLSIFRSNCQALLAARDACTGRLPTITTGRKYFAVIMPFVCIVYTGYMMHRTMQNRND